MSRQSAKGGSRLKNNNGTCSVDVPPAAVPRDSATGRPIPGFSGGHVSPPSEPGVPCRLRLNLRNGPIQLFVSSAITTGEFCSYLSRATGHTIVRSPSSVQMPSVPRRLFNVIDDYNLAGPFERHEFQPELLLHGREQ
jgi:hypothetical protein